MEWSKLKNMIIALLVITNLFLFSIVLTQELQEDNQEQMARTSALEFLAEQGIQVAEEQVPQEIQLIPQQVTWNREEEASQAQKILGPLSIESLGGDILRYYSDKGELRFYSNGEFSGNFPLGAFPHAEQSPEEHGAALLQSFGFSSRLLSVQSQGDTTLLLFQQLLHDIPLIQCEAQLVYQQGSLVEISQGKRMEGTLTPHLTPPITVATALMNFSTQLQVLGDVCSQISNIQTCYLMTTTLSAPGLLTPVWHITTDTGEYYLNTLTGALQRVA